MPEAWKRKVTERALERMRNKPAWLQRQEAIEMAERSRATRNRPVQHPEPEDGDNASTQRGALV